MPGPDDPARLEAPAREDDLYHSRGEEVLPTRPLLTGDVLADVEIPGLDDGRGLAIVLTHPCSMRSDGVHLQDRIFVARVVEHAIVPASQWNGHYPKMPLQGLIDGASYAALFDSAGLVRSELFVEIERVACLSEFGVNLLQQRLIFHLTRFVAPTFKLHESCVGVFREIELHEEWAEFFSGGSQTSNEVDAAFHEWLREGPTDGTSRQGRLRDDQQAAAVRREMRAHLAELP